MSNSLELVVSVSGTDKALHDLAEIDGALSEMSQSAAKSGNELASATTGIRDLASEALARVKGLSGSLGSALGKLSSLAARVPPLLARGAVSAATAWYGFNNTCLEAQKRLDELSLSFQNAFGSKAGDYIESVAVQCSRLGLEFQATAKAAMEFFSLGKDGALAGRLGEIYSAATDAGAALALSDRELSGLLGQLGELAARDTLALADLEELGGRLPGVFSQTARALGLNNMELAAFIASGEATSRELLPALASALKDEYASAAEETANSVENQVKRMANAWENFKASLAVSDPAVFVVKFISSGLEQINAAISQRRRTEAADELLEKHNIAPQDTMPTLRIFGHDLLEPVKNYSEEQRAFADNVINGAAIIRQNFALVREESEKTALEFGKTLEIQNRLLDGLEDFGGKAGKSAARAATAQSTYTGSISRTQNSIAALQKQLEADRTIPLTERKIKIEEKYQNTLARINAAYEKRSGSERRALELKQLREKEALLRKELELRELEEKQSARNVEKARGQLQFYKELGQLSGGYINDLELQNSLLEAQARRYREELGISGELIQQWLDFSRLQQSTDPFDGARRGLLKFQSEYSDSAKQWESIARDFGKSFMDTSRNIFDDFLDKGSASFADLKDLFKKLLKDLAWQALAQPVVLRLVAGVSGALDLASTAGSVSGISGISGGSGGSVLDASLQLGQQAAMKQLFNSAGTGLFGGITESINSAVASMFPNTFAANSSLALGNQTFNAAASVQNALVGSSVSGGLPTSTFTQSASSFLGNFAASGLGAGIGSIASPFVNSLLGLENNSGSSTGSMIGGLAGTIGGGVLAMLPATAAIPGIGWIAGGLGALGSLLGGGIGSLFGGGQKSEPKLEMTMHSRLWNPVGEMEWGHNGGPSNVYSSQGSYYVDAETTRGASGQVGISNYLAEIGEGLAKQSWNFANALGSIDESMKRQYLGNLESQGVVVQHAIHRGGYINENEINKTVEAWVNKNQEAMIRALSGLDLKPLTRAADGLAADTAEELGLALNKIFSFANLGDAIEDEELKEKFNGNVIPQLRDALDSISLAPLAKSADGLALRTLEELSSSLNDVFSVYDIGEMLSDENIKSAYQEWAQKAISEAFRDTDLSFLRVDFDKNSFEGLQKAYAAVQAWNTVQDSIGAVLEPARQLSSGIAAASAEFDGWLGNLRALGWQEDALAELEAKRADYLREIAFSLDAELSAFLNPVSQLEKSLSEARARFDEWMSSLRELGCSEEEISQAEARRSDYLREIAFSLDAELSAFLNPVSQLEKSLSEARAKFDDWMSSLRELGYSEEEIIQAEARRSDYLHELAFSLDSGLRDFLQPTSEFESAMRSASEQFDDWIASLKELGYSEEEIIALEARRAQALREEADALRRADLRDLGSRLNNLAYGQNSFQSVITNLGWQNWDELQETGGKYGTGSDIYKATGAIQYLETVQVFIDQLAAERDRLFQKEAASINARIAANQKEAEAVQAQVEANQKEASLIQRQIRLEQQKASALQKQISALDKEIAAKEKEEQEARKLAEKWLDIAAGLRKFRKELWQSENNLRGTRYQESYALFDGLWRRAMQGDEEAYGELQGGASELLELARNSLSTRSEYNDVFYDVDQKLKQAQEYAEKQYRREQNLADLASAELEELEKQRDLLQKQLDGINAGIERLNGQVEALNSQNELLNDQISAINELNTPLREQLTALQEQQDTLNAQLETERDLGLSLEQLNGAIAILQDTLARGIEEMLTQKEGQQRLEELLRVKTEQVNSIAYEGRTDWTKQEVADYIHNAGLTIEKWYDLWGRYENLPVTYDTGAARQAIVANKVAALNAEAYQGRTDWTAEDFYRAIGGNTADNIDKWYHDYGLAEGISNLYKSNEEGVEATIKALLENGRDLTQTDTKNTRTTTRAIGSGTDTLVRQAASNTGILNSSLGCLNTGIGDVNAGLGDVGAWLGSVNSSVSGLGGTLGSQLSGILAILRTLGSGGSGAASSGAASSGAAGSGVSGYGTGATTSEGYSAQGLVAAGTGIYGSNYDTEYSLLLAKTRYLNKTRWEGRGNWLLSDVRKAMLDVYGSVEAWYKGAGKAEGFAGGGMAPANQVYMVGEKGPELLVSPKQWGVLSSEASRALLAGPPEQSGPEPDSFLLEAMAAKLAELVFLSRQSVYKLDAVAVNTGRGLSLLRMWEAEGMPEKENAA